MLTIAEKIKKIEKIFSFRIRLILIRLLFVIQKNHYLRRIVTEMIYNKINNQTDTKKLCTVYSNVLDIYKKKIS